MARIKLAVAIIHGIGTQPDQRNDEGQHVFAEGLIAGLRQQLGIDASDVAFQSLYWAIVLDNRQYAYLQSLRDQPVRWRWLRRIVTLFLGDASGYRKVSQAYYTTYEEVHQCLRNAVREQARWRNLYAPADPLGYPLRPLPSYAAVFAEDRAMPVGPWYARHTPLSHLTYWHDKRFQRYIGRYLRQLLSAC